MSVQDEDRKLEELGYKASLPRVMDWLDNLMTSIGALYFIGGLQALFSTAFNAGGTAPTWSNWIFCTFMILAIASSLAEICSLYPTAGSIYYWGYRCAHNNWNRFFGWSIAFMNIAAWVMNCCADAIAATEFILTQPTAYGINFPSDPNDINSRAIQFGITIGILLISTLMNMLPHKYFSALLKMTAVAMFVLYMLHIVWLPIAVSRTYGFNDAALAFTTINNGNGASTSYNWFINILFPMYALVGFDASGHVAEETTHSSRSSPAGVFGSAFWSAVMAIPMIAVFIFCYNQSADYSAYSQQIVGMYADAFGLDGQLVMVVLSTLLYFANTIITIMATSRLAFAMSRDGILPRQLSTVGSLGQPVNAILFVFGVSFILMLTLLGSTVAFASIVSGSVICILISYGLVIFARLFLSYDDKLFENADWSLGKLSRPVGYVALFWCFFSAIVLSLPQEYPVTDLNFNYAPIITICIFLISTISWFAYASSHFKGLGKIENHEAEHLNEKTEWELAGI
ncbi:hypothetical protein HK103_005855 [Boothiomyces macroporosus]|uniref:Amino acid transporter n=1 Tax=Boothiomyces macroporosus TaxID=261099 RepID=A0AAD5Y2G2_9FUNG|nr:hypothetical protein HK103_005855 [Boothiomyces macroporosus]